MSSQINILIIVFNLEPNIVILLLFKICFLITIQVYEFITFIVLYIISELLYHILYVNSRIYKYDI